MSDNPWPSAEERRAKYQEALERDRQYAKERGPRDMYGRPVAVGDTILIASSGGGSLGANYIVEGVITRLGEEPYYRSYNVLGSHHVFVHEVQVWMPAKQKHRSFPVVEACYLLRQKGVVSGV